MEPEVKIEKVEFPGMRWLKGLIASFKRPDGQPGRWEGISGGNSVLVLAFTSEGKLILVRQFRFLIGIFSVELPGGVPESCEDLVSAGKRELLEETGYEAEHVSHLGTVALWNAKSNAQAMLLLAQGCHKVRDPKLDPVEQFAQLTVEEKTLHEVLVQIASGDPELHDPTLGHALLIYLRRRERVIL